MEKKLSIGPNFGREHIIRLTSNYDQEVAALINEQTSALFGPQLEVEQKLIECFDSIGLKSPENGEVVAAICLNDSPNVPCIHPCDWDDWLSNLYQIEDIKPISTLWFHLIAWHPNCRQTFMETLIKAVFEKYHNLQDLMIVVPPGSPPLSFISPQTKCERILPRGFRNYRTCQTICLIKRKHCMPQFKVRRAIEGDNDTLANIIYKCNPMIREFYGDYFIAEIVVYHKNRQLIVAENQKGVPVGVFCVNDTINFEVLNEQFELVPYNGLRKPDPTDTTNIDDMGSEATKSTTKTIGSIHSEDERDARSPLEEVWSGPRSPEPSSIELEKQDDEDAEPDEDHKRMKKEQVHEEEQNYGDSDSTLGDEFSLLDISSLIMFEGDEDEELEDDKTGSDTVISAVVLDDDTSVEKHTLLSFVQERPQSKAGGEQTLKAIPVFNGPSNSFVLEIAAVLPEWTDCLHHLLASSFACYPDRDYLICSLPSSEKPHYEVFKYFTRVTPRAHATFPHELYILHKCAFLGDVSVRHATSADDNEITKLLGTISKPEPLLFQYRSSLCSDEFSAFVLICERRIVGIATISQEAQADYLDAHYDLLAWTNPSQHRTFCHGLMENLVISPVFDLHAAYFLREIHRLTSYSALFYRLYPIDTTSQRHRPLNNMLGFLVPLTPRKLPEYDQFRKRDPTVEYDQHEVYEWKLPNVLKRQDRPFSLYLSTKQLLSIPHQLFNCKIVVVGTGVTATAFLETMVFPKNPNQLSFFTNVTAVSPHGLTFNKKPNLVRDLCFVSNGHLDHFHMNSTCLITYVNVETGVMTGIDRQQQTITINNDHTISYDYLVLLCGEQYQKPQVTQHKKYTTDLPVNVFIINTDMDAKAAISKLKPLLENSNAKILVYGHHLDALCCLNALTAFGFKGFQLSYINSSPTKLDNHDHITNFLNNQEVEDGVFKAMEEEGIKLYHGYSFVGWFLERNMVKSVKFETKYKLIEMECAAIFFYQEKTVSTRTSLAFNKAGLVFDGHLIINHNFQTNDPKIFAAGTLTKYSATLCAQQFEHRYFNGEEIGVKLGRQLRNIIIRGQQLQEEDGLSLRIYMKPIVKYCKFPGGINYLNIRKPGKTLPLEVDIARDDYGKVLVTGKTLNLDTQGYFRLHLNKYKTVETITCLSKEELNVQSLISLWGKHCNLLNNLSTRFDRYEITDLFEYFSQPWCCAIYHDRFNILLDELNELVNTIQLPNGNTLMDEIVIKIKGQQENEIENVFKETPHLKIVEQKVLDFIEDNCTHLPMYAHSLLVRIILRGISNSPMFNSL